MSSPRVIAVRLPAALLLVSLLIDTVVLALLLTGRVGPAAIIAATSLVAASVLFVGAHRRLTHVTDQLIVLEQELADVIIDRLTGLVSREAAERFLDDRCGYDLTLGLVNVDDQRGINAAHGYQGGDDYLWTLGRRLLDAAAGGLVARLGGDEFVIVSSRDPLSLAAALDAALRVPATVGHSQLPLRVSVGITGTGGRAPHHALAEADLAMFTAKQRRLGIAFYDRDRDGDLAPPDRRPPVRRRDQGPAHAPTDDA